MKNITVFNIPIKTVTEANIYEHWTKKAHRHRIQKWIVKKCLCDHEFKFKLPVEITLIRIAPNSLDKEDNLPMSLKYIKDYLADYLRPGLAPGRADDSKEITWKYDQRKGNVREYSVEVIVEEL
jgi:hypothetical protein